MHFRYHYQASVCLLGLQWLSLASQLHRSVLYLLSIQHYQDIRFIGLCFVVLGSQVFYFYISVWTASLTSKSAPKSHAIYSTSPEMKRPTTTLLHSGIPPGLYFYDIS